MTAKESWKEHVKTRWQDTSPESNFIAGFKAGQEEEKTKMKDDLNMPEESYEKLKALMLDEQWTWIGLVDALHDFVGEADIEELRYLLDEKNTSKIVPVFPVEEMVMNPPEGMEGYRFYRLEYGGVNQYSLTTGNIWLPPWVDEEEIVAVIERPPDVL